MTTRPNLFLPLLLMILAIAQGGWADDEKPEPVTSKAGFEVALTNNVAAASFLRTEPRTPKFYSTLYFSPYYKTPELFADKIVKFSGDLGMNVDWINPADATPANPNRTPRVTDLLMRASMPKLLNFKNAHLTVTPALETETPVSSASLNANRVFALGASIDTTWSNGGLSLTYKPLFFGYFHSVPYKSSLCAMPNPVDSKRPRMLADGRCLVDGQQTLGLLRNALTLEYVLGSHTFTAGVRTYHAFLRPPANGDDKTKASNKNYTFSTLGLLEYAYTLPIELSTYLALGLASYQPAFSKSGNFKFPFFDFETPGNSEFYFKINLAV